MPFQASRDSVCCICGLILRRGEFTRPITNNTHNLAVSITDTNTNRDIDNNVGGEDQSIVVNASSAASSSSSSSSSSTPKTPSKSNSLLWSHLHCVPSPDDVRIPICKHWLTRSMCMFRDTCLFRHPDSEKGKLQRTQSNPKRYGTRGRLRVLNEGRASALRRWLVMMFGESYLRSGSGVIEVAGGKGELSFEFVNLNGIPSCIFDPRPTEIRRYQRKLIFGYFHRNDVLRGFNSQPQPSDWSQLKAPTHIRGFFEMPDLRGIKADISTSSSSTTASFMPIATAWYPNILQSAVAFQEGLEYGRKACWTNKGLEHENDGDDGDSELSMPPSDECAVISKSNTETADAVVAVEIALQNANLEPARSSPEVAITADCTTENDHLPASESVDGADSRAFKHATAADEARAPQPLEIHDYDAACQIIRDCSAIVGLHPDQATEHILRFAILNNKPCAIIPCCVYGKQFPNRKTKSGQLVRHFGDLVEYLLSLLEFCEPCGSNATPSIGAVVDDGTTLQSSHIVSQYDKFGAIEMDFEGKNIMIFYLADKIPQVPDVYAPIPQVLRGPASQRHWWALSDCNSQKAVST